jgi:IS4 transposase
MGRVVQMRLSPDAVRTLLTSVFPPEFIDDRARECGVVERDRDIDIRMLVWTLAVGFAVGGETRSIADYRRAYNAATNQSIVASSFYDRFTENLQSLLSRLLDHALAEVAVPHHVSPEFDRFRDVIAADATIFRLQQLLAEFEASHDDASGVMLYLVHNVTDQSVISDEITDETTHESTLFETGSWLRGRLFLLDLAFFKYRRFALIDENDGFFVSRLKKSANPLITATPQTLRGNSIDIEGEQVFDIVGDLRRQYIDVDVVVGFKRREYDGERSTDTKQFRVVGVRNEDTDDYHLYMTNLPREEFTASQIATLYRARWEVELLFRELKSRYALEEFNTSKEHIVKIQITAALLTLVVSRAILRVLVDHAEERGEDVSFPTERWATTFRSYAQLILMELADLYGFPPPNIPELLYQEAKQPSPGRKTLLEEVCSDLTAAAA